MKDLAIILAIIGIIYLVLSYYYKNEKFSSNTVLEHATTSIPDIPKLSKDNITYISSTSCNLAFSTVPGATSYEYILNENPNVNLLNPVLTLTNLKPNATYSFQLIANNSIGSIASKPLLFTTLLAPPLISNNMVSNITSNSCTITWDPVEDAISYKYKLDSNLEKTATSPLILTNLKSNRTYSIKLASVNKEGTGDFSVSIAFTTTGDSNPTQ
jgi:hypothetical protein